MTAVTETSVTFTAPSLPAGDYNVIVNVDAQGNALSLVSSLTGRYNYTTASSPETFNLTPTSSFDPTALSITGTNFGNNPWVSVGTT